MPTVTVNKRAERSLLRRHPWVFSGGIEQADAPLEPGETVDVRSADGMRHGRGACSPVSQIAVRMWTFDPGEDVNADFFRARLSRAVACRRSLMARPDFTACRLVNAESDGLPGLIADRYGDVIVCQFLTVGSERWREVLVDALQALLPGRIVYERSDADVREKEGLPLRAGALRGGEPPDLVDIREGPCTFLVDVRQGHKTGFYLDQRENRGHLADYAAGADVLNCFAYTGAFGVWAAKAGAAHVTNVESSASALSLARRHVDINGLDERRFDMVEGSVPVVLRSYRDAGRAFDLIILDPPKFAEARSHVPGASRGYKDINLLAFKLLRPGGIVFTFSCSGHLEADLFQKIVADAALDARRDVQILRRLGQADDHPTATNFPEGTYLKGLICRAL